VASSVFTITIAPIVSYDAESIRQGILLNGKKGLEEARCCNKALGKGRITTLC
jgi:hypothetical protein